MSWLSQTMHGHFDNPLVKYGAPAALAGLAIAAPYALPALGGALGVGAAGAAAEGGAAAAGGGLFEGLGLGSLFGGGEGAATGVGLDALALAGPEGAGGGLGPGLGGEGLDAINGALNFTGDTSGSGGLPWPRGENTGWLTDPGWGVGGDPNAGAAAGGQGPTGQPGFWDRLVGGATKSVTDNPLGIGAAGLGLGYNIYRGQQQSAEMKALTDMAGPLNEQSAAMRNYLQTGTLPPGLKTAIDQASSAMKARIISNHARHGMSTDPSQNSALAQELNSVDMQATGMMAQQGLQLLNTGVQMSGMSQQLYIQLERLNREQNGRIGSAIANFAAALGGAGNRQQQRPAMA